MELHQAGEFISIDHMLNFHDLSDWLNMKIKKVKFNCNHCWVRVCHVSQVCNLNHICHWKSSLTILTINQEAEGVYLNRSVSLSKHHKLIAPPREI